MAKISLFAIILSISIPLNLSAQEAPSTVALTIDRFVETLFPENSHFFWIVNDTKKESQRELIIDLNAVLTSQDQKEPMQSRFLLLLVDGKLFAAQNIPLNAKVDCGDEKV